MEPEFKRHSWRFKLWLFGILGLLAVLAWALLGSFRQGPRDGEHRVMAAPEQKPGESPEKIILGQGQQIAGTSLVAYTLILDHSGSGFSSGGSYSGSEQDQRNILLVDLRDGANRYVLPDNRRRVVQWDPLPDAAANGAARGYAMLVGDRVRREGERYDVLLGNFATGQQTWIARGVTAMDAPQLVGDNAVGMLLWEGSKLTYRRYDLETLKIEASRVVPVLPAAGQRSSGDGSTR